MPVSHRIALLLVCLIWAGNFIAAAIAVEGLQPITFTLLRFAVVLALLFPFIRMPQRGQWLNLLVACWCMGALHFGLVFVALSRSTDISSIAILMQIYVPFSTLLAVVILGERIGWRTTSAIALAFSGVLVVGLDPLVLTQLDVLALVLCSAFLLAVGTVFMRRVKGVGLFSFQGWNALLAMLPLAVMAWLLESPVESMADLEWTSPVVPALLYSSIGASIIGHGTFYWLIQRHEVNTITPYLLLIPILAVLLGVLIWGDRPGPRVQIGGAMIIGGVLWVTLRARYRGRPIPDPESGLFTTRSTAVAPVPASTAFSPVAHPHRTGKYASGALDRENAVSTEPGTTSRRSSGE